MGQRQIKASRRAARRWRTDPATGLALPPDPHIEAARVRYKREAAKWVESFRRWATLQVAMGQLMTMGEVFTHADGFELRIPQPEGQDPIVVRAATPEDLHLEALLATGTGPVFRKLEDGRQHVDRVTFGDTTQDLEGTPDE